MSSAADDDPDSVPPPRDATAEEALSLAASWTDQDVRMFIDTADDTAAPWRNELPAGGTVLNRIFADDGRQWWCVALDSPVRHRIPSDADHDRYPEEYRDRDEFGDFFWTYMLLVSSDSDAPMLIGSTDHPVALAAVLDPTVREDAEFNLGGKADPTGHALVEIGLDDPDSADMDGETPDDQSGSDRERRTEPEATPSDPTGRHRQPEPMAAVPRADASRWGDAVQAAQPAKAASWIHDQLNHHIAALRALAGDIALSEIPLPRRIPSHSAPANTHPQYVIDGETLSYYSRDPRGGFGWQTTTDPSELLYWCVDDVARSLAWRWTQRAPAFSGLPVAVAQRTLWAPYWQLLMTALDPGWGAATSRALRTIL